MCHTDITPTAKIAFEATDYGTVLHRSAEFNQPCMNHLHTISLTVDAADELITATLVANRDLAKDEDGLPVIVCAWCVNHQVYLDEADAL